MRKYTKLFHWIPLLNESMNILNILARNAQCKHWGVAFCTSFNGSRITWSLDILNFGVPRGQWNNLCRFFPGIWQIISTPWYYNQLKIVSLIIIENALVCFNFELKAVLCLIFITSKKSLSTFNIIFSIFMWLSAFQPEVL